MYKFLYFFLVSIYVSSVHASEIFCEGWYQEAGQSLEKARMKIESETAGNTVFRVNNHGYDFKVDWNRELTTFYVCIEKNGSRILATTARVPTDNHPENFTDLNIPNGPRLSVNCEMH